jgi:8-oxo-dGTP pyrophosphatase MutT (NUDIX family)
MEAQSNDGERKCVTAVIFDNIHNPFFLILKRKRNWTGWEFVKGGIEAGETEEQAVIREIKEETGLQKYKILKRIEGVDKKFIGVGNKLNVHSVYLIEASMNIPIHIPKGDDPEHSTYLWCDKNSTMSKLTWDNDKKILERVLIELRQS